MDAVAEEPLTVLLSSHLIADLERVCDHLMVLRSGQVTLFGATDELVATHKLLTGPPQRRRPKLAGVEQIVSASRAEREIQLLARTSGDILDPAWDQDDVSLEDVVLPYLAERPVEPLLDLEVAGARPGWSGGSTASSSGSRWPRSSCSVRSSSAPAAPCTIGSPGRASSTGWSAPRAPATAWLPGWGAPTKSSPSTPSTTSGHSRPSRRDLRRPGRRPVHRRDLLDTAPHRLSPPRSTPVGHGHLDPQSAS
jgi:hypothetical protein